MQIPKQVAENSTLKLIYPTHSLQNNSATYFPFNIAKISYNLPKIPLLDPEKLATAKKISDSVDPKKKYPLPSDFYIKPNESPKEKTHKSIIPYSIKEKNAMHVNDISKNIKLHGKDFNLKKSSSIFSNLIYNVKSTYEKTTRLITNKINSNKKNYFHVKFKQEGNSNISKANKTITNNLHIEAQRKETIINTNELNSNIKSSYSNKESEHNADLSIDFNNTDLEWDNDLHLDARPIIYTDKFKHYITQRFVELSTPSTHELNKLLVDSVDMKPINRLLDDMEQLNKEEKILFSSNESLNSNSSGYYSDNTIYSEYNSKTKVTNKLNDINISDSNKKQKTKNHSNKKETQPSYVTNKIKNTDRHLPKRTTINIQSMKKKQKFNDEIYQTKTSKLRAQHNKEKYQLSQNNTSSIKIQNHEKTDTKKLDNMLQTAVTMANDLEQFGQKIMIEESNQLNIKNQLLSLEKQTKSQ